MRFLNRVFVSLQYALPHHVLSRLAGGLARLRWRWFKNGFIRAFVALAGVDMREAASDRLDDYPHFASFFTRPLRPGIRPLPDHPKAVASPVDGLISQIGRLDETRLLQAKGRRYDAGQLLGGASRAAPFAGGHFVTLYLAPHQYHRVHMPLDGALAETVYLPGRLFSVGDATVERVPNLFGRNERLVCLFDTAAGPMAQVLVGALLVAGIETVWAGALPRGSRVVTQRYDGIRLARGDEMGRFNMGSTVILLFGPHRVRWLDELGPGAQLHQGQMMGRVTGAPG